MAPAILPDASVRAFTSKLGGSVLSPGAPEFEGARRVWNATIDLTPRLIVRCADVRDVVEAVRFAREQGLSIAVRGGGHNAAGLGTCEGGLVIDLGAMNAVQVDPKARLARAGGGAKWADLDRATGAHGLATTGGAISSTGIGGLTLGGGLGWLMRKHGMTCDNLVGAEVVTADGRVVHASATENPDLLWGLRGGGGNFGVVTTFEYRLHPVSTVLGGMLVFPFPRAREVMRGYRDFTAQAPDELTVFCGCLHSPDGMKITALLMCYAGPLEQGEKVIAPLRALGPVADQVAPMPYVALQGMLDPGFPAGMHVYWRSEYLAALNDAAIDTIVDRYEGVTSPLSALLIEQFGGAVRRMPRDETAYDNRDADYNLAIISRWTDPAERDRHVAWARGVSEATRPFTTGRTYVNYMSGEEGAGRVQAAYGPAKYARLQGLKRKYYPDNVFRMNQNIPPA
jgi:FAD/FMN-containing dehydrogenase